MRIDIERLQNYLLDIKSRSVEIESLLNKFSNQEILEEKWRIRGLKYLLIELAEIMANTLAHILAKGKGEAVAGYVETIIKAGEKDVISKTLSKKLKPFFDFRNSLVHRYWTISDDKLAVLVRENYKDFSAFVEEIEKFLKNREILEK